MTSPLWSKYYTSSCNTLDLIYIQAERSKLLLTKPLGKPMDSDANDKSGQADSTTMDQTTTEIESVDMANTRCHLLELPSELRLRIYEYALAPTGTLTMTRTKAKRFATEPVLAPTLLPTCRQIHSEAASILYNENTVCITVDAHDTCWPTIAEARLPQRVLAKIQNLSVILDTTSYFTASYADVDWKAFSALTSLKKLRLVIITVADYLAFLDSPNLKRAVHELLTEILERIPASTEVSYGTANGFEERKLSDRALKSFQTRQLIGTTVKEFPAKYLAVMAAETSETIVQGCRSGTVDDVYRDHFHVNLSRVPDMAI